jgi:membrane-associated phospholipid phosphatase
MVMVEAPAPPHVRTGRPLVTPWARYALAAVIIICVGVTAWLGIVDHRDQWANTWDLEWMYRLQHRFAAHMSSVRHVADLGGPFVVTVVSTVLAVVLAVRRRIRALVLVIASPIIAEVLTELVLKPWVHRAPFGTNTYPSGHSTGAFTLATVAAILLVGPTAARGRAALRWTAAVAVFLLAGAIAVALVAGGYHFATDTIGGAAVGIATTCLVALVIDTVSSRLRRSHV